MTGCERIFSTILVLLNLCCFGFIDSTTSFEKIGHGILESQIQTLAIHPQNKDVVFAGTSKAVYKSNNAGRDFLPVFQVSSSASTVNYLYMVPQAPFALYAATDSGFFVSRDEGKTFEKIFTANDEKSRRCLWVAQDEESIYLGTEGGVYYKSSTGSDWKKGNGVFANTAVNFIYANKDYFYLATANEVYRLGKNGDGITKIFSLLSHETNIEEEISDNEIKEDVKTEKQIRFMVASSENVSALYLATVKGIFESTDTGESWQRVDSDGLPLEEATSLIVLDKNNFLLGTTKGIFSGKDGKWSQLYKGLETNKISFLSVTGSSVYAATDRGIYVLNTDPISAKINIPNLKSLQSNFHHEPSIREVQKMAVEYAEVNLEKITSWRRAAQKKAWLPTLSTGINRSATDLFHWDTGSNPDTLLKGREMLDWDISLSWNLGELIWNNDQTSIDSRSKLMVELREDVLDQVTRLYFERRRIQIEFASNTSWGEQERLDKEMRIAELTALIDGFTGGHFSLMIEPNEKAEK